MFFIFYFLKSFLESSFISLSKGKEINKRWKAGWGWSWVWSFEDGKGRGMVRKEREKEVVEENDGNARARLASLLRLSRAIEEIKLLGFAILLGSSLLLALTEASMSRHGTLLSGRLYPTR